MPKIILSDEGNRKLNSLVRDIIHEGAGTVERCVKAVMAILQEPDAIWLYDPDGKPHPKES